MQVVPVAGKLAIRGRIASARAAGEAEMARDVAWEARSKSAMAFYELHRADVSLGIARETLRLLLDLERTAEAMYRVGEGQQADLLRAQVEVARMVEDTLRTSALRAKRWPGSKSGPTSRWVSSSGSVAAQRAPSAWRVS